MPQIPQEQQQANLLRLGLAPMFRCVEPVAENLICEGCQDCLVQGYVPDCFIGVRIGCHCGAIIETPRMSPGDILPSQFILLGDGKSYGIGGTVDYAPAMCMTTSAEIYSEALHCHPRSPQEMPALSEMQLQEAAGQFEHLTGLKVSDLIKNREQIWAANEPQASTKHPFAWSIFHLRRKLTEKNFDLRLPATRLALTRLSLFHRLVQTWGHHPHFVSVAPELANPPAFYHTVGLFSLAEIMFTEKIKTTFVTSNVAGEKKPDLYLRPNATSRLYIEFKAPQALSWSLEKNVELPLIAKKTREILRTTNQINRNKPGILALMVNHPADAVANEVGATVRKFLKLDGRSKPALAAVVVLHVRLKTINRGESMTTIRTDPILNEHWANGPNPVSLKFFP